MKLGKQKMTWTIEWRDDNTGQLIAPQSVVKIEKRPTFEFNSNKIFHIGSEGPQWIPGKPIWEEMKVTYRDVEHDEGGALFFHWISKQYSGESKNWRGLERSTVFLRLHCGEKPIEVWQCEGCFITSFDFGYGLGDIYELNVSFRFSGLDYSSFT